MLKSVLLSVSLLYVICGVAGVPKGGECPKLRLNFGRVRYRQKGRFVKFMCNTGYIIAGEKYSTCHNGSWDSPMPKCVRASCVQVNPPINGLIYPSHRGAVLNFFCKPGYQLRGPNTTYCDGHNWDNKLPACIVSNTPPSLSCDFETEDLCGWNHDLRHDFDWRRMNFRTPSGHLGTGPSWDHTQGEGLNGYYMYIESSSRNANDTARLISPIYDKMNSNVCLEFFYHMHGSTTGQLRVYLKKESGSWDLDPNTAFFWKSGNHGDRWIHSLNEIGPIDEDFQIIIEGVRGESYFSDIAIDDVNIIENCTISDDVTTMSDVTYTDEYPEMQSCLNRCDNDNLIVQPANTFQFSCGCDETCTDNNTCCPDYIAICLLGVTDDFSSSDAPTTTPLETTTTQNPKLDKTTTVKTITRMTTMEAIKIAITDDTPQVTPKKNKTGSVDTNEINSVLPKSKVNTTSKTDPPKKYNLANATNFNRTPQPFVPPGKKPILVFLTPSTPEVIIQKIKLQTTTAKKIPTTLKPRPRPPITTTPLPQRKTIKPTLAALTIKTSTARRLPPTTQVSKLTTTQLPIDEILTVSQRNEEDRTYFVFENFTTKVTTTKVNSSPSPIKQPDDTSGVEFSMFAHSNKMQNQKVVKEKPETNTRFIIIAIASVSVILLVALSAVLLVRRHKFTNCRRRNRMNGTSSDSQSDVRFLTSDEVLDFNLAYTDM